MNLSAPPRLRTRASGRKEGDGPEREILRRRSCPIVLAGLLFAGLCASAPVSSAEPSIEALEERFVAAYERIHQPIWNLNAAFSAALQRLLAQETAAGNLDAALEIKTEIAAFGDGRDFDSETFLRRPAETESLASTKTIYARERERLWNEGSKARADLLSHYAAALTDLERQMTRESKMEEALRVRRIRESLGSDARFAGDTKRAFNERPFTGRIHLIAKGDIQLEHNGNRVTFRNTSSERAKYFFGTSRDLMVSSGDTILLKMRSTVVFRSFIMAIESVDEKIFVPFKVDDFRYLGDGRNAVQIASDREELLRIVARPERGGPDPEMADAWRKMPISHTAQAASEWAKSGPGSEWHHYAVVIRPEMLKAIEPQE